jgi:hypothetical protein
MERRLQDPVRRDEAKSTWPKPHCPSPCMPVPERIAAPDHCLFGVPIALAVLAGGEDWVLRAEC